MEDSIIFVLIIIGLVTFQLAFHYFKLKHNRPTLEPRRESSESNYDFCNFQDYGEHLTAPLPTPSMAALGANIPPDPLLKPFEQSEPFQAELLVRKDQKPMRLDYGLNKNIKENIYHSAVSIYCQGSWVPRVFEIFAQAGKIEVGSNMQLGCKSFVAFNKPI